jgi:hypothetical protein
MFLDGFAQAGSTDVAHRGSWRRLGPVPPRGGSVIITDDGMN